MITTEDIIKNIFKETGLSRSEPVYNVSQLSKKELKDVLVYIVNVKNRIAHLERRLQDTKVIVKEVMDKMEGSKDGKL